MSLDLEKLAQSLQLVAWHLSEGTTDTMSATCTEAAAILRSIAAAEKAQGVTVEFSRLRNLAPSRRVPLTKTVAAGREAYMLSLTRRVRSGETEYRLRSRIREAGR